ncbi:hypothetical protein BV898_08921 [Hypsibius exemplaris]|uniref:C2H2-type domain-containing protein n=1 Tax=Hypsibius exemplaris TaxID=2072580 RepID=A0A1W0WNX6_HYPEX|nr:hypothetical protein BV898_08921 [Hypsibius exemplaris]
MKIPPVIEAQQQPKLIDEILQAVADAKPFRFLDFVSSRAVWSHIHNGLVALNHLTAATTEGSWMKLMALVNRAVVRLSYESVSAVPLRSSSDEVPMCQRDALTLQIRQQMQEFEAAQLSHPCGTCGRRFVTAGCLQVHARYRHPTCTKNGSIPEVAVQTTVIPAGMSEDHWRRRRSCAARLKRNSKCALEAKDEEGASS